MKKILLVTRPIAPPWDEASKNFAFSLARDLSADKELELHLMTNGPVADLPEKVIEEHIYTHSQNDFGFSQKIRSLLFQFATKGKFDINHYIFTPTKLNSWVLKNWLKSPHTKSIQTVATLREDIFSDEEIKKLIFADLIVTYSDYAKNKLQKLGFQNVERIYPGIDLEKYQPREKNSELLKECSFTDQDFIINFTGEYARLGAIDLVIDSFIAVSKLHPEIKLSLAVRVKNEKDAAKKKEVIAKLEQNNLWEKVAFYDNGKYAMSDIYNLADISLFPVQNMHGKFDVPLAVVEAMACEKPVIISNLPVLQEFANNANSVTIKPSDPIALSDAILDLYQNPQKRQLLGKAGRKFCQDNFDIKKVAKKYAEIYKKL